MGKKNIFIDPAVMTSHPYCQVQLDETLSSQRGNTAKKQKSKSPKKNRVQTA